MPASLLMAAVDLLLAEGKEGRALVVQIGPIFEGEGNPHIWSHCDMQALCQAFV